MEAEANVLEGTEIVLVRHGRTVWNQLGKFQGAQDSPLLPEGIASAKALARRLAGSSSPIVCAYSSPLGRAWHTAEHLVAALNIELIAEPLLTERNYGCLEGLTHEEQWAKHPEVARKQSTRDEDFAPPGGGESRADVKKRASAALLAIARRHPKQRVLVVTHSGLLSSLMNVVLNQRPNPNPRLRTLRLANTALNLLRWSGDGWQLVLWGDVGEFAAAPPVAASSGAGSHLLGACASSPARLVLSAGAVGVLLGAATTAAWFRRCQ